MPRRNRPAHGGKREGAGRPPGSKNKIQRPFRVAALEYGERALQVLGEIMNDPKQSGATRVSACALLLDRAYGRARLPIDVGLEFNPDDLSDSDLVRIIVGETVGSNGHAEH